MLRGLPPVLLIRAEHEILWDEILDFGRNIAEVGHEVRAFVHDRQMNSLWFRHTWSTRHVVLYKTQSNKKYMDLGVYYQYLFLS